MNIDYSQLLKKVKERHERKLNDHLLVIDGTNTLIRSFSLVKHLNTEGTHIGGMVGFLRSLGFLVRTLEPTRVICVFDGQGGSVNRKHINPEYKAQRVHTRLTNWGLYNSKEEEKEALYGQYERLTEYLKCLPIQTLCLDKLEADDIIAYLALNASKSKKKITIVSTDKDFLQLVNTEISVYSPVKKVLYTPSNIQEALQVPSSNYNVVKALLGDDSDNLEGVKGLGLKTLLKHIPEIGVREGFTLEEVYSHCERHMEGKKILATIIDSWDKVETNYTLMNLHQTVLSTGEIEEIREKLSHPIPKLQSYVFLHLMDQDKIEGITTNTEGWLQVFGELDQIGRKVLVN